MRIQKPKVEDNWLYKDIAENDRWFTKQACLRNDEPDYPECTQAEREEWEKSREPLPEPEKETEESVAQPTE